MQDNWLLLLISFGDVWIVYIHTHIPVTGVDLALKKVLFVGAPSRVLYQGGATFDSASFDRIRQRCFPLFSLDRRLTEIRCEVTDHTLCCLLLY